MPLTPKNRKEEWLQGLVDHETTLTPKNRPEEWMKEIIDASGSGGGGGTGVGVLKIGTTVDTSATPPNVVMDKTWAEIADADFAVCPIASGDETDIGIVVRISSEEGVYGIYVAIPAFGGDFITFNNFKFSASSENDYPTASLGQ